MAALPAVPMSRGSKPQESTRLLKARFGDGYTQVAADGLNSIEMTFEARWQAAPIADINTLVTFFRTAAGVQSFTFTIPGEANARTWRCEQWTGPDRLSSTHANLSARFVEVRGA